MTLSPDDLAAMGERHREITMNYDPLGVAPDEQVCAHDEESWPCAVRRLLDEVEALRSGLDEIADSEIDWTQGVDENFTRLQVIAEKALGERK